MNEKANTVSRKNESHVEQYLQAPFYARVNSFSSMTGLSRNSIYRALEQGKFRAKKVGGCTLIDVTAALEWLKAQPDAKFKSTVGYT